MKELRDYLDIHKGEEIIVVGLGESMEASVDLDGFLTIGVNDVARVHHPDYLVLCDPPARFQHGRLLHVLRARSTVFSYPRFFEEWKTYKEAQWEEIVNCPMQGGLNIRYKIDHWIPSHTTSTYVAVALAAYMGAKKIGMIGVDFHPKRFWEDEHYRTGFEGKKVQDMDDAYGRLALFLGERGVRVINLSPTSRLTKVPKGDWFDFKKRETDAGKKNATP